MLNFEEITPEEYKKFILYGAGVNIGNTTSKTPKEYIQYVIMYLNSKEKTGDEIIHTISPLCKKINITDVKDVEILYNETLFGIINYKSINNPVLLNIQKEYEIPEEIMKEAKEIYKSGKFIDYIMKAWNKSWYKDLQVIRFVLLIAISNYVINAEDGLHLYVAGDSGTGKSDSVRNALHFLIRKLYVASKFTKTWIYYGSKNESLHEKQIILNDDTTFDEEHAAILRNMLSSWLEGATRETVDKSGEPQTLTVPKRVTLILTSVNGISQQDSEGQDESRYTTMLIKRTKQDENEIKMFMQTKKIEILHELEVIHAIWTLIEETEVELPFKYTTIPVYKHKTGSIEKSMVEHNLTFRELKKYRTMLMCNALLHGRKNVTKEDEKEINEHIITYCSLMESNTEKPMTEKERIIDEYMKKQIEYKSIAEIETETGVKNATAPLFGRSGGINKQIGGLCKIRAIEVIRDQDGKNKLKYLKEPSIKPIIEHIVKKGNKNVINKENLPEYKFNF